MYEKKSMKKTLDPPEKVKSCQQILKSGKNLKNHWAWARAWASQTNERTDGGGTKILLFNIG